jgi:hypothetical protein
MKKYLAEFEFISGEYGQMFFKVFRAKEPEDLEKQVDDYLSDYYGEEGFDEKDGNIYFYNGGAIAVKCHGYEELTSYKCLIEKLNR